MHSSSSDLMCSSTPTSSPGSSKSTRRRASHARTSSTTKSRTRSAPASPHAQPSRARELFSLPLPCLDVSGDDWASAPRAARWWRTPSGWHHRRLSTATCSRSCSRSGWASARGVAGTWTRIWQVIRLPLYFACLPCAAWMLVLDAGVVWGWCLWTGLLRRPKHQQLATSVTGQGACALGAARARLGRLSFGQAQSECLCSAQAWHKAFRHS